MKGYHLWRPDLKAPKLFLSIDVIFDESTVLLAKEQMLKLTIIEIERTMKKIKFEIRNKKGIIVETNLVHNDDSHIVMISMCQRKRDHKSNNHMLWQKIKLEGKFDYL